MGNGDTYTSIYGHLSSVPARLKKGTPVKKGETIGYAGNSGNTTGTGANPGTHLHFELRKGKRSTGYGSGAGSDATWISTNVAHNILPSGATNDVAGYNPNPPAPKLVAPAVPDTQKQDKETWDKVLATKAPNMDRQVSLLKGLYSGDTTSILNSIKQMGINMGMTAGSFEGYMNNPLAGTNYVPGGSGDTINKPGSGTTNNNVSIVVQVPDVTSADAVKFAQLVKQYLDDNSLMSNTGSI
jgi:hypothetical protein